MQTVSFKEKGPAVGRGTPSQASGMSWWSGSGSQMMTGGACNSFKSLLVDHSNALPASSKDTAFLCQQLQSENEGVNVAMMRRQLLSGQSGYHGIIGNDQHYHRQVLASTLDSNSTGYLVPHTQLELGHIAHTAYPCGDSYFGGIMTAYGDQAMIHPHLLGLQQGRIPLPSDAIEDEPIYVNAKQYRGILRRRKLRAKAELENKVSKGRKPYLHESRHLHALRRARGCGGRFLNTKKLEESKGNTVNEKLSQEQHEHSLSSSGSEALNSENGNTSSAQEVQGNSTLSGSEVTSLSQSSTDGTSYHYSRGSETYPSHHPASRFHVLGFHSVSDGSDEVVSGQGMGYPMKWITAKSCCDQMKV